MPTRSRRAKARREGATVYTLSETASDAEAARLAEAENRADVIAGVDLSAEPDDVANILIDLAQRETKTFSAAVRPHRWSASCEGHGRLHKNPLKSAGFKVLKAPDVPSVLIELGYVSTKDDLKLLTSDGLAGQDRRRRWRRRSTPSSRPGWRAAAAGRPIGRWRMNRRSNGLSFNIKRGATVGACRYRRIACSRRRCRSSD